MSLYNLRSKHQNRSLDDTNHWAPDTESSGNSPCASASILATITSKVVKLPISRVWKAKARLRTKDHSNPARRPATQMVSRLSPRESLNFTVGDLHYRCTGSRISSILLCI